MLISLIRVASLGGKQHAGISVGLGGVIRERESWRKEMVENSILRDGWRDKKLEEEREGEFEMVKSDISKDGEMETRRKGGEKREIERRNKKSSRNYSHRNIER